MESFTCFRMQESVAGMCIGALTIIADFMGAIGSGTGAEYVTNSLVAKEDWPYIGALLLLCCCIYYSLRMMTGHRVGALILR